MISLISKAKTSTKALALEGGCLPSSSIVLFLNLFSFDNILQYTSWFAHWQWFVGNVVPLLSPMASTFSSQLNRTTKAVTIDGALLIEVDPAGPVELVIDGCTIQQVICLLFHPESCSNVYTLTYIHPYYIYMIIYILYIIVYIPIVLSFRFLPYLGKFPWPGATTGRGVHTSALGSRGKMMDFTMKNGGFHHPNLGA